MQTILFPGTLSLRKILLIVNIINPSWYAISCIFSSSLQLLAFFYINIFNKAFAPKAKNNAYLGGLCAI